MILFCNCLYCQLPNSPFEEKWPSIKEGLLNKKSTGQGIGITKKENTMGGGPSKSNLEICLDNN